MLFIVISLHSKMYLFLPFSTAYMPHGICLYIPKCIYFYVDAGIPYALTWIIFTFQNVSISTL